MDTCLVNILGLDTFKAEEKNQGTGLYDLISVCLRGISCVCSQREGFCRLSSVVANTEFVLLK